MKRLRIYRELEISEGQIKEGNTKDARAPLAAMRKQIERAET